MNARFVLSFLWAALSALLAAGCAPTAGPAARPAVEVQLPDEPARDLPDAVFMGEVAGQDRVLQNDAFRAMLIWLDGKDPSKNFEDRVVTLVDRGLLKGGWQLNPNAPLDKATLAYMVYKALGMRGGLSMMIFDNRRYALRELVYRDMMARGADYAHVSGSELVATLGRADDYRDAAAGVSQEPLPALVRE